MFRGVVGLACTCACACAAAPPPDSLPTPEPLARPAAPRAAPVAPACLHDADATDVSFLHGDARVIDVCFAPTACFAIDRRTRAIAATQPQPGATAARAQHRVEPLSFTWVNADAARVCASTRCMDIRSPRVGLLAGGRADLNGDGGQMLVTVGGDGTAKARFFTAHPDFGVSEMKIDVIAPCAEATWLDDRILVTSDDCNGGPPIGLLYGVGGRLVERIGLDRPIDTHGATSSSGAKALAVVAPRAYALVLVESPTHQSVIDLVPIQAESTPDPRFDVAPLGEDDWVVASSTGGVGVVDYRTTSLAKTWIIPRCEASP
jgi:hypothetical protein